MSFVRAPLLFLAVCISALAAPIAGVGAKEGVGTTRYWDLEYVVSTIIFGGRPIGLLTVVPVIDMGAPGKVDEVMSSKLIVHDHLLLGLSKYATAGYDPRAPLKIKEIKRDLQEQLDLAIGPGRGTVYIVSAHIAKLRGPS